MSRNDDRILGHADESDGIEEYDNPLPDWWLGLFLFSIVWGIAYAVEWHLVSHRSQEAQYDQEIALAKVRWPDLDRPTGIDTSPETLAAGREVFQANCTGCHGATLEGGIGPNLVDGTWIHGGAFEEVRATITDGVPPKGMPTWGPVLGPKKIAAVASFVLSQQQGGEVGASAAGATTAATEAPAGTAATDGAIDGADVFAKNCVACHGTDGTGGVGPNLTDDAWIHGGELDQIRATITNGVPAKGMVTWKGILSDEQIAAVATFVHGRSHPKAQ